MSLGVLALVLPAPASAAPDIDFSNANPVYVATAGETYLTLGSLRVSCTSVAATGQWATEGALNTSSGGTIEITFKGCIISGVTSCTTLGHATGEITSEALTLDVAYIKGFVHTAGILITNPASGVFATSSCGTIKGTGLIGHIESPKCGEKNTGLSASFETIEPGVPRYQEIEGSSTKYHWLYGEKEAGADSTTKFTYGSEATGTLTCI